MRAGLLALLLLVPAPAAAARKHAIPPTPATPAAERWIPDPPFVEAAPTAHPMGPEAAVFAAFKPVLCGVTATRIQDDGTAGGVAQGSAFVIHGSGLVLTNHHVVAGASELVVRFSDGRAYPARVAGADPALDIAVLGIDGEKSLSPAVLGD